MMSSRVIEIRKGVLSKNDQLAVGLRARFAEARVYVINVMSSPGTGKTAFLERLLRTMTDRGIAAAVLVGDLETDNDARRLARSGAQVRQIQTHGNCHLEGDMISTHLEGWDLNALEFLVIENVGNLVCPASYDLGENLRVAMLSVTEGEDKPLKYPVMFSSADVAVITKVDLAAACECDLSLMHKNLHAVHPGMQIFESSAKTGAGVDKFIEFLTARRMAVA